MKKKSLKGKLYIGTIINARNCGFYRITKLLDKKFECQLISSNEWQNNHTQEFYYNIDMEVYHFVDKNY